MAFSVKYFLLGFSYLGSSVCTNCRKPSFSTTLYGRRSSQINPAIDFVILAALGDEKGRLASNIAFTAAGWLMLALFSATRPGWWHCKRLCMFMVLPVYFIFTLHIAYSLSILFFPSTAQKPKWVQIWDLNVAWATRKLFANYCPTFSRCKLLLLLWILESRDNVFLC